MFKITHSNDTLTVFFKQNFKFIIFNIRFKSVLRHIILIQMLLFL